MKALISLTLAILMFHFLKAQEIKPVPPSPNAASLGQYGDVPVGNYTGSGSVSIPLYTIQSGELTMPISLNYHASGIRVAQEASWVGLGWSLSAGGVITRQIAGIDDFKSFSGYLATEPISQQQQGSYIPLFDRISYYGDTQNKGLYEPYLLLLKDPQPDIFYYNFFGYSGRLLIGKQSNNPVYAIAVDQNNLVFSYDFTTEKWQVKDSNGWVFVFGTKEITRSLSQTSSVAITSPAGTDSEDMVTGWYLDSVTSPSGDQITFTYQNSGRWIVSQPSYSEQIFYKSASYNVNNLPGAVYSALNDGDIDRNFTASVTKVDEIYLQRIDFKNGYISFTKSDRQDRLSAFQAGSSQALSAMTVHNFDGAPTIRYDLYYSYFNPDKLNDPDKANYLRLKLESVRESRYNSGNEIHSKPAYIFTYNQTPLPAKTSASIDQWGYYNGADNTSIRGYRFFNRNNGNLVLGQQETITSPWLTPRYTYIGSSFDNNVMVFFNGADREVNTNFISAGSLEKVQYPTGGTTTISYESNDFSFEESLGGDNRTYEYQWVSESVTSHQQHVEKTFTLTDKTFILVEYSLTNPYYLANQEDPDIMYEMTSVIRKSDGTDIVKFIPAPDQIGDAYSSRDVPSMKAWICAALEPGTYTMILDKGYNANSSPVPNVSHAQLDLRMKVSYVLKVPTIKKKGGGLRIKTVENRDGGVFVSKKRYEYENNGHSTGRLMAPITNFYNESALISQGSFQYQYCCFIYSFIVPPLEDPLPKFVAVWSETVRPMGNSAQGNPVGYDTVRVYQEDESGGHNGFIEYRYKNTVEEVAPMFLPSMPNNIVHTENGQLLSETTYSKTGIRLKSKSISYRLDSIFTQRGIKVYKPLKSWFVFDDNSADLSIDDLPLIVRYYDIKSTWWNAVNTYETTYDENGQNPQTLATSIDFENSAHKLQTRIASVSSTGETRETRLFYPGDFPSGTSTLSTTLNRMKADNILTPVIKEETKINGSLVDGAINNFTINSSNDVVQTDTWQLNSATGTYEKKFDFEIFNPFRKILQQSAASDVKISYLWAYNGELPVVRGENIDYATLKTAVESAAGVSNLESFWNTFTTVSANNTAWKNFNAALRSLPSLQAAKISTYTYLPLIGLTSETDLNGKTTYYEYDNLHRLKIIRNHDGEIVKTFEYQYR